MKRKCKRLASLVLALSMCLSLLSATAWAGAQTETVEADATLSAQVDTTTTEVEMTVTYGQTEARSILAMINEFRTGSDAWYWNDDDETKTTCTGLSELTYDYTLEAMAMQRAAEIALSYSHTRPNGTSCSTVYDDYSYIWYARGENIAAGYTSAESVFEGWQETDDDYSGQGHRRNMLSSSFTAVGIGHVTYNGVNYWVQVFAKAGTINTTATTANNSETTVSIDVLSSSITSVTLTASPSSYNLSCNNENVAVPTVTATLTMSNTWPSGTTRSVSVSPHLEQQ